jgi:hypothetical protein
MPFSWLNARQRERIIPPPVGAVAIAEMGACVRQGRGPSGLPGVRARGGVLVALGCPVPAPVG